jgi:hypothetical protein
VPIVDHDRTGSIVVFGKVGGELSLCATSPCRFVPIRDTAV